MLDAYLLFLKYSANKYFAWQNPVLDFLTYVGTLLISKSLRETPFIVALH